MKRLSQSGFAIVELAVAVVVVAALGGGGYYIWHKHNQKNSTASTNTTSALGYQSPPVTTPAAPQIKSSSDLNSAMTALNQTNVTASNTDSTQLSTQAAGF